MKNKLFLLFKIAAVACAVSFSTSCRKSHMCNCTTLQPGLDDVTSTVIIDNTNEKAATTCSSWAMTVVGTATTTCALQ